MSKKSNRVFTAVEHVGPYSKGHPFDEQTFRTDHPLPDNPEKAGIDPESYHDGLLNRLISKNIIKETPDAEPEPTEPGAHTLANVAKAAAPAVAPATPIATAAVATVPPAKK